MTTDVADVITKKRILETKHGVLQSLENRSAILGKWGLLGTSLKVDHFWNWVAVLLFGLDQEPASRKACLELTLNHRGYLEAQGKGWLKDFWINHEDLVVIASLDASYAQAILDDDAKKGLVAGFKKFYRPFVKMCAGKPVTVVDRMKMALMFSSQDVKYQDPRMELVLGVMTILHSRRDKSLTSLSQKLQDRLRQRFGESLGGCLDKIDRNGPYRVLCDLGYQFKWECLR